MSLPLAGLRVLDLTNVMAGPFGCYQLALMGADVIKIETPGSGDLARQLGADAGLSAINMGASYLAQNAGKKSVAINLKDPRGKTILKQLVKQSDALVESFRPGVMARLELSAEILRAEHPRLVYCALSGFGQSGPLSQRPAYDQIIQGLSGLMSVTGDEQSAPLRVGFPISDAVAGLNAAMAVAAGLVAAARTGEGSTIDVSMLDSSIAITAWVVSNYLMAGEVPKPMGNENRTASPSGAFKTAKGLLNIAANKQDQWEKCATVIGRSDLIDDPRFRKREDRKRNRAELKLLVEDALMARTAAEWEILLNDVGVPSGRIVSVPEALSLDQLAHREFFRSFDDIPTVDRTITVTNGGFLFEGEGRGHLDPPATLGQHSTEILRSLGLTDQDIATLRTDGVI